MSENEQCTHHPCHINMESCKFCYCPFYSICPDYKDATEGYRLNNGLWACENCEIIHRKDVAKYVELALRELYNEVIVDKILE